MTASELLEELKTRLPNAAILLVDGGNVTRITSIAKPKSDTAALDSAVVLMGEPVQTPMPRASALLSEALAQGVSKRFNAKVTESVLNPGKFQVSIDGYPAPAAEFGTQAEAKAYMHGFTIGFSVGGGIKNIADGLPSRIE
jgi:hypothetical protein